MPALLLSFLKHEVATEELGTALFLGSSVCKSEIAQIRTCRWKLETVTKHSDFVRHRP